MQSISLDTITPELFDSWVRGLNQYSLREILIDNESLPDLPGLYFVYIDREKFVYPSIDKPCTKLAYIGISATSIKKRWLSHHKLPVLRGFLELNLDVFIYAAVYLPGMVEPKALYEAEKSLIRSLKPFMNGCS